MKTDCGCLHVVFATRNDTLRAGFPEVCSAEPKGE